MKETVTETVSSYGPKSEKGKDAFDQTVATLKSGADKVVEAVGKLFEGIFKS